MYVTRIKQLFVSAIELLTIVYICSCKRDHSLVSSLSQGSLSITSPADVFRSKSPIPLSRPTNITATSSIQHHINVMHLQHHGIHITTRDELSRTIVIKRPFRSGCWAGRSSPPPCAGRRSPPCRGLWTRRWPRRRQRGRAAGTACPAVRTGATWAPRTSRRPATRGQGRRCVLCRQGR